MGDIANYKSVHQYMDALFKGKDPTDKEIKQAKASYRKLYQKHYRSVYKAQHIQITFRVSKEQYKTLTELAKAQHLKVTTLVKQKALKKDKGVSIDVKIQLSELLDNVEASIYQNRVLDPLVIVKQLEKIEANL